MPCVVLLNRQLSKGKAMTAAPLPVLDVVSGPAGTAEYRAFREALTGASAAHVSAPPNANAALIRELGSVAAAVDQIVGLLVPGGSSSEGLYAAERVQDIALSLRQHRADPNLCDALDEAVREVTDAMVGTNAAEIRATSAAALLRHLSRRLNDLIAAGGAVHGAAKAAAAAEAEFGGAGESSESADRESERSESAGAADREPASAHAVIEIVSIDARLPVVDMFGLFDRAQQFAAPPERVPPPATAADEIGGADGPARSGVVARHSSAGMDQKDAPGLANRAADAAPAAAGPPEVARGPEPMPAPMPDMQAAAIVNEDPHVWFDPLPVEVRTAALRESDEPFVPPAESASQVSVQEQTAAAGPESPSREDARTSGALPLPASSAQSPVTKNPVEQAPLSAWPGGLFAALAALSEEELTALFS
jgi:hypothetical protein